MGFTIKSRQVLLPVLVLLFGLPAAALAAPVVVMEKGNLGIIRGIVRDEGGSPIADATVAIFRAA